MIDIVATQDDDGNAVVHRPDCPVVLRHSRAGLPLMRMFGCEEPLPETVKQHSCLKPHPAKDHKP